MWSCLDTFYFQSFRFSVVEFFLKIFFRCCIYLVLETAKMTDRVPAKGNILGSKYSNFECACGFI